MMDAQGKRQLTVLDCREARWASDVAVFVFLSHVFRRDYFSRHKGICLQCINSIAAVDVGLNQS
jgi:hypothetical protein